MSKKLIKLDNGLLMEVEISENSDGIEQISGGGGEILDHAEASIGAVEKVLLQSIQPVVNAYNILTQEIVMEKAEVEIGIGFSAEGNIFVAKGSANANLKVKLILKPKE